MGCSPEASIHYAPVAPNVEPAYMTLFRSGELADARGRPRRISPLAISARATAASTASSA